MQDQAEIIGQQNAPEMTLISWALDYEGSAKANELVAEGLTPAHFSDRRNAEIWKAIANCAAIGSKCDMSNICTHLVMAGRVEQAGGYGYITAVTSLECSKQVAWNALDDVRNAYMGRRLALLARHITACCERGDDARKTAAEVSDSLTEIISEKHREPNWTELVKDARRTFGEDCAGNKEAAKRNYILWGIDGMDREFHPMERGEFVAVAARTSCGKSSLSRQVALAAILRGESVLIHTLETGGPEFARNLAGNRAMTRTRKNLQQLTAGQRKDVDRAFDELAKKNKVIVRTKEFDLATIAATGRAVKQTVGLDLWVIDYLGLITDTRPSKAGENMAAAIGKVTQQLKQLAQTLECVIVCPVQINRAGIDEPNLHHLQDSGRIEQDASRVIIIHIPEKNSGGVTQIDTSPDDVAWYEAKISQKKGRNYGTGSLAARFHRESATFVISS